MGTPEFAKPALQKLLENDQIEIVGIYTKAPKIAGRGQKISNSPIHELALKHNLKIFTPLTLKDEETQQEFKKLNADAALIVAYGLILPKIILESTKFGCINIHPSILPKWRGATPIQSTLFAGDSEIGVSIIKMEQGVDSGDIILQEKFAITDVDNYGNLAPKLAEMGADMAVLALFSLRDGKAEFIKQDDQKASFSKKIVKTDAKLDFNQDSSEVLNKIRALSGFLTSFYEYKGEKIKIFSAKIIEFSDENYKNGEVVNDKFVIKCAKNAIQPLILQREGKKPTTIDEFLRGFRF